MIPALLYVTGSANIKQQFKFQKFYVYTPNYIFHYDANNFASTKSKLSEYLAF